MKPIFIASLLLLCALPALAANKPLPTQADIDADLKAQKFNDAIQKIGTVLSASKTDQGSYDMYKLQMTRGEVHLNLKNSSSAKAAYADAEKAATNKADAAQAAGMRLLVANGTNGCYKPKAPDALKGKAVANSVDATKPISYIDPATRPAAMLALEIDQLADAKQTLKKIQSTQALTPIPPFARTLGDLRKLEFAVEGNDSDVARIASDLTAHADKSLQSALDRLAKSVQDINTNANKVTTQQRQEPDPNPKSKRQITVVYEKKNGLGNNEKNTLADAIATCNKVGPMCREIAAALAAPDSTFAAHTQKAHSIAQSATSTLRANYGNWMRKL